MAEKMLFSYQRLASSIPVILDSCCPPRCRAQRRGGTHVVDVPRHFGFETYELPGFSDIVSVKWDQSAFGSVPHQFDNIVVPEPSSLFLVTIGLFALTSVSLRRR